MPRSVALTGLLIVMSFAMVGFAAFSSDVEATPRGSGVPVAATAAAAVFAAPLAPGVATPAPAAAGSSPVREASPAPSTTTTTTPATTAPTTTPTIPSATTTTEAAATTTTPPTTAAPTTTTTTVATTDTTTTVVAATAWPPDVERWRDVVTAYFDSARVEEALAIIDCESLGDPSDVNPTSGAAGLFQFLPSTWNWVAAELGIADYASGAPLDPTLNTAAAAFLVQDSIDGNDPRGPWGHWSCRWVLG